MLSTKYTFLLIPTSLPQPSPRPQHISVHRHWCTRNSSVDEIGERYAT